MWRIILAVMIGGGFLCFFGYQEYSVSSGTSSKPLKVELFDVESGKTPDNNYIQLGPHYRLYDLVVYEYETNSDNERVTEYTKVNQAYYPVYSIGSPFGQQMDALIKKYGSYDKFPEELPADECLPTDNLSMIIKTDKYPRVGRLPDGMVRFEGIKGLVINQIESLGSEEKRLLKSGFGEIDFSKVLILEQDRKPTSIAVSLAMMGGGALLIAGPLFVGFVMGRSKPQVGAKPQSEVDIAAVTSPDAMATPTPPVSKDADNNPYRRTD